ncbi:uncharacterized protein LOC110723456 [Chenopodium quinoa]|uniref:uncharacterized protein LOC110723456 n=1 Tax=Chenopodium quinoa TaxID=63459 RepID=UPI000B78F96E|nr:uncharacterized protein LOC110723456 [Chenopodium quinoa]
MVWSTRGPPKLLHFLWSAVKGNLAVKSRLVQRHIINEASCQICGHHEETIWHALVECDAAAAMWEHSELKSILTDAPNHSFAEVWAWLYRKCDGETLSTLATLLWAAWRCRNLIIFENERPNVVLLAARYCRLVHDYHSYAKCVFNRVSSAVAQHSIASWSCPPTGTIKINVDAHVPSYGMAGLGVVCRDAEGKIMAAAKRKAIAAPEVVEVMVVRYALMLAHRLGYSRIMVESDAINVIKAVNLKEYGRSPIFSVYDDICIDRAKFEFCTFSHIKRSCNTVAHLIARWDTGENVELVHLSSFPQGLLSLAEMDLL